MMTRDLTEARAFISYFRDSWLYDDDCIPQFPIQMDSLTKLSVGFSYAQLSLQFSLQYPFNSWWQKKLWCEVMTPKILHNCRQNRDSLIFECVRNQRIDSNFIGFLIFHKIDVITTSQDFFDWVWFCTRMKVMQTSKLVNSRIEIA